eukprot:1162003-Pelagomonas_calceolata.AAC.5
MAFSPFQEFVTHSFTCTCNADELGEGFASNARRLCTAEKVLLPQRNKRCRESVACKLAGHGDTILVFKQQEQECKGGELVSENDTSDESGAHEYGAAGVCRADME